MKKMNKAKKQRMLKWLKKVEGKVKDKGRCKKPAMTNSYGVIIKK